MRQLASSTAAAPALVILLWLLVQAFWSLPAEITSDWNGWRQSDTQTIAENFVGYGGDILHPRINWGGDGPGYVESEFQIYTYAASLVMRVFGISNRPGQWISLLSMAAASAVLFSFLRRSVGPAAALLGMSALLLSRGAIFTSSVVQPDALGFLFYVLAFTAFLNYLEHAQVRFLISMAVFTLLASLIKPTFLHLGIFQFLALLVRRRDLLRRVEVWIAWLAVLIGMALFFRHGHQIYLEYGNTFGIGLAGDSKFPTREILTDPGAYPPLLRMSLAWGFGLPGALAGLYLLLRRRLDRLVILLGIANFVMLLVAYRYTSYEGYGAHYHVVTTLLSGWLVALAAHDVMSWRGFERRKLWVAAGIGLVLIAAGGREWSLRSPAAMVSVEQLDSVAAGRMLDHLTQPGELVLVRSGVKAHSELYNTVNNFEDPIVLHEARVRGWVLPADECRIEEMDAAARAGASYYVDVFGKCDLPDLETWIALHTDEVVVVNPRVTIYRIRPVR